MITLNPVHTQGTQFKEDIDHRKKEKRQKYFNRKYNYTHIGVAYNLGQQSQDYCIFIIFISVFFIFFAELLLCPHELREDDIIIVSENLEGRGLRSLLQHLTMDEEEVDRIKSEFGFKGHSEVIDCSAKIMPLN